MAQSTIIFTNKFTDGTTRKLEIGPFTTSYLNPTNIKTAVKNLNSNPSSIANLYLSKNGANFQEIAQLQISTQNRTIIID